MRAIRFETRSQWLAYRNGQRCIGGSDIAAILGRHPHRSEWALWAKLMGATVPDRDSPRLRMGRRLEPVILDEWADLHPDMGLDRSPFDLFVHREHPWAVCTLDGTALDDGVPVAVVEAKSVCGFRSGEWGEPGELRLRNLDDLAPGALPVPVHYALQVVWQMAVTGLGGGYLVALFGSDLAGVREWFIPRPDWLCDALVEAAAEWWNLRVVRGLPPAVDGSDDCANHWRERLPDGSRQRVEAADPEDEAARLAYEQAAAAEKAAQEAKALARNRLLARGVEIQNVRGDVRLYRRAEKEGRAA